MLYTFGDQENEANSGDAFEVPAVSAMDMLRATARNAAVSNTNSAIATASEGFAGLASDALVEVQGGFKPARDLQAGDMVKTVDNGFQPLRWVGNRRFGAEALKCDPSLRPVRIRAHALAEDQPHLDLVISQSSSILLSDWRCELLFGEDEVLAPVSSLLNDHSIMVDHDVASIEYVYLMFDRHELVIANGVEMESVHVTDAAFASMDDATRDALLTIFPEFGTSTADFGPTARRLLHGYEADVLAAA